MIITFNKNKSIMKDNGFSKNQFFTISLKENKNFFPSKSLITKEKFKNTEKIQNSF